jgi:hypothetical protein
MAPRRPIPALALALLACGSSPYGSSQDDAPQKATIDEGPLGAIVGGPLPIAEMLGHSPPEVQAHLGDPLGKGGVRKSCVRWVPDKTWFSCDHAWQRYADKSGTFDAIGVEYENGKASMLAFEGVPGDGAFEPRKALAAVGLQLPGEPTQSAPAEGVTLYSWFNSASRLRIHGRQYRVEVSTVGGTWDASRVAIVLNDPLSDEEKAKIVPVKGQAAPPAG